MNSVTKINLSNLKHCNQVWTEMPENDLGRNCLKCSNTIIDFRNSTDSEIAEKHLFSENKVCGLYKKEQLQKPIKASPISRMANLNSMYFGFLSLLSSSSLAQENNEIKTEQTDKKVYFVSEKVVEQNSQAKSSANSSQSNIIIISGKLTDENGEPLSGANIIAKGTTIGASTDFDGIYKLNLNKELQSVSNITLLYSYIGFTTAKITIDSIALKENQIINIKLVEDYDSITSFYVTHKIPFYKRIWYKIKNVFRD